MLINVILLGLSWLLNIFDSFRKLEEVHNNFMDEKDRIITEIYNESKERARWLQPELYVFLLTHTGLVTCLSALWCLKMPLRLKVCSVLCLRVNGFKKQTEILRQKHTEFLEKYKIRNNSQDK